MREDKLSAKIRVGVPLSPRSQGGLLGAAMLLLLCLFGGAAEAQFSGPALSVSTVNSPARPTTDPAILYPGSRDIHLAQGDLLAAHLYGAPDYVPPVRVSLDGTIQLPLIGVVSVQGLKSHPRETWIRNGV